MSGIVPIISAALVTRIGETPLVLPDPPRTLVDPIFRPGVARHPGATLILLELRANENIAVRSPATSAVRHVFNIPPLGVSGLTTLIELSPLPFSTDAIALFSELGSVPTFYIGLTAPPPEDELVEMDEELGNVPTGTSFWLGAVLREDGITRAPSAWIEQIAQALAVVDPANTWSTLLDHFPANERRLIVLDHTGRPAQETEFEIRLSGDANPRWTRRLPAGAFDLEQVVAAEPLDGATSLFEPPAGQQFQVRASLGPEAIPLQSIMELDATSVDDAFITIPPSNGPSRLHLQIANLAAWYPPISTPTTIARFHLNSRLEPLIDGIPAFKRLVADLQQAAGPGLGANFTGWAFNSFVLDKDDGRTLVDIAEDIVAAGGDMRMLATKFVQDEENLGSAADQALVVLLLLLFLAGQGVLTYESVKQRADNRAAGFIMFSPLFAGLTLAVLIGQIPELLTFLEPSGELLQPMNDLVPGGGPIAIHSRNPVRFRDNPVSELNLPLDLDVIIDIAELSDHVGVWHNKSQMVKFGNNEHSAYVGGIDINENRLDTPFHNEPARYHDVHCRLTGPVVRDAWISFNERWDFDRAQIPGAPDPIPAPAQLDPRPERHIARIGRTYFGPNPDGQSNPLPFSPEGERSIHDTLVAAIRAAQRYIYIEEQYFTSNGTVNPPNLGEGTYHSELLNAASRCRRLVIVLPSLGDQPWGDQRRRRVIDELRDAWGDRLLVGFPQRRPVLGEGPTVAAVGRTRLQQDVGPSDTHFRIGPAVRVPPTPFWMWVDGELMLIHSTTAISVDEREVDVVRANGLHDPARWFSTPRAHKKGAPVTHSALGSIYVHAKAMVVDDVFVAIGSANVNRRGFFHDGEITAFAIPERLAAAPENPARALRIETWAQHLGLPPVMGAALLGDPIAGTDFLLRSPWLGNRFTPIEAADLHGMLHDVLGDNRIADGRDMMMVFLKFAGVMAVQAERFALFNTASDPTSFVDPNPISETF